MQLGTTPHAPDNHHKRHKRGIADPLSHREPIHVDNKGKPAWQHEARRIDFSSSQRVHQAPVYQFDYRWLGLVHFPTATGLGRTDAWALVPGSVALRMFFRHLLAASTSDGESDSRRQEAGGIS